MHTTQTNLLIEVKDSQNREAWGRFYRIYAPMLRHFAHRMGLSETDAEDLAQEVLIIVHRALQNNVYEKAKGSFRAYLYGIARRQALAALRHRNRPTRFQFVGPEDGISLIDQVADRHSEEMLQTLWEEEWRRALLSEALLHVRAEVSDKVFQAFLLYFVQNKPVEEVAGQLQLAPASVYVYKARIETALKEWVAKFEERENGP